MIFFKVLLSCLLIVIIRKKTLVLAEKCLGVEGACDLKLQEVTLIGAHNAGAGFNGKLYYHNPYIVALSCKYRYQYESAYSMLEYGIRYFDIDLCYEDRKGYIKGAWGCYSDAYGGPMSKFLSEIDKWMNEPQNRREIVVLNFNKNHEKGKRGWLIGDDISHQLKSLWDPREKKGNLTMQNDIDEKLGHGINQNKRIYVFLSSKLRRQPRENFFFLQDLIGYTEVSMRFIVSNYCKNLVRKITDNCYSKENRPFVSLDLYLSSGLCIEHLGNNCNKHIKEAYSRCNRIIKGRTKVTNEFELRPGTVNFIVLDYATNKYAKHGITLAKEFITNYILEKNQRT